jgi:Bacterial TSP3 repeat
VERERGLDPKTFDSDGDGLSDAEELRLGTDPTTQPARPDARATWTA